MKRQELVEKLEEAVEELEKKVKRLEKKLNSEQTEQLEPVEEENDISKEKLEDELYTLVKDAFEYHGKLIKKFIKKFLISGSVDFTHSTTFSILPGAFIYVTLKKVKIHPMQLSLLLRFSTVIDAYDKDNQPVNFINAYGINGNPSATLLKIREDGKFEIVNSPIKLELIKLVFDISARNNGSSITV